jgi:MOSC domain-containing protein YiiM
MDIQPTIASITYRPDDSAEPLPPVGYRRVALSEATLLAGQGIDRDAKAQLVRNLNIMDAPTLAELAAEGYPTAPGSLGENIILADLDLRTLIPGTRVRLGEQAVVELIRPRTGCQKLHAIDARMPDSIQGRIGMMAQVVREGRIRVGDTVEVLRTEQKAEQPVG